MEYDIGAAVHCTDGSAGQIKALIANPFKQQLAHLAVETDHKPTDARLVPVALVKGAGNDGIELSCSLAELARLPAFHDLEFVPFVPGFGDPGVTLAWPYFGLPGHAIPAIVDLLPPGEVEIRRHDRVHATDGAIGRVEGLVVDTEANITHVLLQEGHLWDRREVAIPIGSFEKIDEDGIYVRLSKQELADLPELGIHPEEPPTAA
jgi:hypothetical protein